MFARMKTTGMVLDIKLGEKLWPCRMAAAPSDSRLTLERFTVVSSPAWTGLGCRPAACSYLLCWQFEGETCINIRETESQVLSRLFAPAPATALSAFWREVFKEVWPFLTGRQSCCWLCLPVLFCSLSQRCGVKWAISRFGATLWRPCFNLSRSLLTRHGRKQGASKKHFDWTIHFVCHNKLIFNEPRTCNTLILQLLSDIKPACLFCKCCSWLLIKILQSLAIHPN